MKEKKQILEKIRKIFRKNIFEIKNNKMATVQNLSVACGFIAITKQTFS